MRKAQLSYATIRRAAIVLLCGGLAACSSDGDGGSGPGQTPAISITLSANSATVPQGGTTQVNAVLARSGGFSGTVNLNVTGAPTGVTGAVSNITDSGGSTTGTITIQVASTVAPGTYTLNIRGSGSGVADATASFTLTVATFGFTITAQPTAISLAQGTQGSVNIAINRSGGFAGSITLVATGGPGGFIPTITPPNTTGNSAVMTLAIPANASPGSYTIGIGAAATGVTSQAATVTLTITSANPGGGNASVNLSCYQVLWFAYQDGNGAWTPVTGVNGVYSFNITAATGGYTYVIQQSQTTQTVVQYYTRSEMTTAPITLCPSTAATKNVNGTVSGIGLTDRGTFWLGAGSTSSAVNGPFMMTNVQQGTHDFIAYRHDQQRDITGIGNPDRAVLRRDLNIPAGGSVAAVDFNAGDSFAPATATVTVNNAASGEQLTHGMSYYTGAACTPASLYTFAGILPGNTFTASGIPTGMQRPTDFHQIFVTALVRPSQTALHTEARTVLEWFRVLGNRTVALPTALAAPTVTTLVGPYKRLQAAYSIPADYQLNTIFAYTEATGLRFASVSATLTYLGGSNATLAMPNFDGLAGWNNTWPPTASSTGTWFTQANGNNLGTGGLCVENARVVSGGRLGSY